MQKQLTVKIAQALKWRAEFASGIGLAVLKRPWLAKTQFIGITGSTGKTTTKDLAAGILKYAGGCNSSQGSANNPLAVARTIVKTKRTDNYCVLEVSGSKRDELTWPLRMFQPDIAVITTIQREHVKADYTLEAVAKEKSRLVKALPPSGTAVLNIDDSYLKAIGEACSCSVIWVGESEGATLRLVGARSAWPACLALTIEHNGKSFEAETQLHGTHLALAVMAALGVAVAAGVPLPQALSALALIEPPEGRMQIVHSSDGIVFIRDDWKAPYWSLDAPLNFLKVAKNNGKKVAIIGTLSDFSAKSGALYKRVCRDARKNADLVVFVGAHAHRGLRGRKDDADMSVQGFRTIHETAVYLRNTLLPGDLVLLKGSAKVDHLVRLVIDRHKRIQCWRDDCRLNQFCNACPALYTIPQQKSEIVNVSFDTFDDYKTNVVIGLGNCGNEYSHTPHNIGHRILDMIAKEHGSEWKETAEGLAAAVTLTCGTDLILFKPAARMNNNGEPIRYFLRNRKSNPAHCLVVHDDIDLHLGKISLKHNGGDGGHKGLRSTIASLGTDAIHRLRIGIRRPEETRKGASQRVIEAFSASDEVALKDVWQDAVSTVRNHFLGNNNASIDNDSV